jgi:hypothetical protein
VREYDGRIRRRTILLTDLLLSKIVLFTSYALAGLTLPSSTFYLMLLENYGFQLHHLTPHAIALVVIFIHLYDMYMGVQPLVHLFWEELNHHWRDDWEIVQTKVHDWLALSTGDPMRRRSHWEEVPEL